MQDSLKKDRHKAIILAIVASALWSTGGMFVKLVDWNPVAISGTRSFAAGLVLLLYIKKPKITKSKSQTLGSITYALTVLSFIIANKLTTSANAILLQYTAPIFVAMLGVWILKEKIHWYDLVAIFTVFLGMGLFFLSDVSTGNMIGNLLAIFCGFTLACTTIALKSQKEDSALEITLFGNVLAFLVSAPFIFMNTPDLRSLVIVIIMGVFQLGIPFIFYVHSMKHLTALEVILITVVEPLLNPLWVFIFTGEQPGIYPIIGGIIVITTVVLRSIYVSKKMELENLKPIINPTGNEE